MAGGEFPGSADTVTCRSRVFNRERNPRLTERTEHRLLGAGGAAGDRIDDQRSASRQNRQARKMSMPTCRGVGAKPRTTASRVQRAALVDGSMPADMVTPWLKR